MSTSPDSFRPTTTTTTADASSPPPPQTSTPLSETAPASTHHQVWSQLVKGKPATAVRTGRDEWDWLQMDFDDPNPAIIRAVLNSVPELTVTHRKCKEIFAMNKIVEGASPTEREAIAQQASQTVAEFRNTMQSQAQQCVMSSLCLREFYEHTVCQEKFAKNYDPELLAKVSQEQFMSEAEAHCTDTSTKIMNCMANVSSRVNLALLRYMQLGDASKG
eukprot:gnl/Spiro4/15982_TR8594_c0_g1_i1.p1 gnl/Spiro4/15982_TR8594_c0_g1~~gnl/Spiro4/15982_TR8594_c0_g1_i1.p1  ORF type:complete len:218 (+),score=39.35 gnl/Spiro4/15982_TR8594_c0_g1_i1:45-698(+)